MLKELRVTSKWYRKLRNCGLLQINENLHLLAMFWTKDKKP